MLFHYASHHNVLEKVVMYETEVAAQELRAKLRNKEDIVESLAKELEDLRSRKSSSYSHYSHAHTSSSSSGSSRDKRDSDVKDDIQGKGRCNQLTAHCAALLHLLFLRRKGDESYNGSNEG